MQALQQTMQQSDQDVSVKSADSKGDGFYIPSLDGIRACAFSLVFIGHAGLEKIWSTSGAFGVTIFFFLSGYLITTLLRMEAEKSRTISLRRFYLRRLFRIFPPMYITLAIAYILGLAGILATRGNWFGLISSAAYFYNYAALLSHHVEVPTSLGILWSLMIEEHFYLIFPVLYFVMIRKRFSRRKQAVILLVLCAVALAWRYYVVYKIGVPFTTLPRWTVSATDCRFDSILFGCILAILNNPYLGDESPLLQRFKGAFAIGGLLLIAVSIALNEPHYRETLRYTLQGVALYAIFYYCISSYRGWQAGWLEWKPLRWIGWLSYSLYLIHLMFLQTLNARFPLHAISVAVVSFGLSVAFAWLMRLGVETPLRNFRARLEKRLGTQTQRPTFSQTL